MNIEVAPYLFGAVVVQIAIACRVALKVRKERARRLDAETKRAEAERKIDNLSESLAMVSLERNRLRGQYDHLSAATSPCACIKAPTGAISDGLDETVEDEQLYEVFVVMEEIPYEYGEPLAVFTTKERAEKYIATRVDKRRHDITHVQPVRFNRDE